MQDYCGETLEIRVSGQENVKENVVIEGFGGSYIML